VPHPTGIQFVAASASLVSLRKQFSLQQDYSNIFVKLEASSGRRDSAFVASRSNQISLDSRYTLSVSGVAHSIRGEHFAKLLRLYRLHTSASATLEDQTFVSSDCSCNLSSQDI
jgi:hypothetical protein